MTDKTLQSKAITFKGKKYVLVSDRVKFFNDTYKNGCIKTKLISRTDAEVVIVKAYVYPDMANPERFYTGFSQAKWGDGYINKTSALENCETSAVGRALGLMGIGVVDSIASIDEINKANARDYYIGKAKKDKFIKQEVKKMDDEADGEVNPEKLPF